MKRLRQLFAWWPYLVVAMVWLFVVLTNYTPGTWLLGWDNLVPEFNLPLNLNRAFFTAWQEYQGLGLLGGMAHGASLSRELILWLFSSFVPQQLLRYGWAFAMLLLGPMGAMTLFGWLYDQVPSLHGHKTVRQTAVLVVGIFYLLNLATIQYFYAYFETFASFYGFLPWLVWSCAKYLNSGKLSDAFTVVMVGLLSTSSFQVQTLFVVWIFVLAVLCVEAVWQDGMSGLKRAFLLGLLVFVTNAFWLLPVGWFTISNGHVNVEAKQNLVSTPELQLMNQAYGDWEDIPLLRGYWFNYKDYRQEDPTGYLMPQWRNHLAQPGIPFLSYVLFALVTVGIAWRLHLKGNRWNWWLAATIVMYFIMVSAGRGNLGLIYQFLTTMVPFFGQIFRTAFTKWSMVGGLVFALGLGWWVVASGKILHEYTKAVLLLTTSLTLMVIFVLASPVFSQGMIYPKLQLSFPTVYLELFDFFATQPKQARVLFMPTHTLWGWNFYSWGLRGSGFLWYGIEQPIVDRAFDMFSVYNEQAYHQLSASFYGGSTSEWQQTLDTYDIRYVLIDESVVIPLFDQTARSSTNQLTEQKLRLAEAKSTLEKLGAQKVWSKEWLSVYELPWQTTGFVYGGKEYQTTDELADRPRRNPLLSPDRAIVEASATNYDENLTPNLIAPWLFLQKENPQAKFRYTPADVTIPTTIPNGSYELSMPTIASGTPVSPVAQLSYTDTQVTLSFSQPLKIITSSVVTELPQLPDLRLATPNLADTITVVVNGYSQELKRNQPITFQPGTLYAHQPITLEAFDASAVTVAGEKATLNEKKVVKQEFPASIWQALEPAQPLALTISDEQLSLQIGSLPHDLKYHLSNNSRAQNCSPEKVGVTSKEATQTSLRYDANTFGIACDAIPLDFTTSYLSYLLHVVGENITGRNPSIYLVNQYNNRVDLEWLVRDQKFDQTFAVLSWPAAIQSLYSFHLDTRSLAGEKSGNSFTAIDLYPLPLNIDWISSLSLRKVESAIKKSALTVENITKWGTSFYTVTASAQTDNSLVVLSQGYDVGWIALLNGKMLPHVRYDGWANAWLVPEGTHSISLIFWPQLLVFAGFGLLGIALVTIVGLLSWRLLRPTAH